jgi:hypothetical protein
MGIGEMLLPGSMFPASSQIQTSPANQLSYQSWAGDIRLAWEFPVPGAQSNGAMVTKFTREHPWASASLGCLRGETRKADKSCATGRFSGVKTTFRALPTADMPV